MACRASRAERSNSGGYQTSTRDLRASGPGPGGGERLRESVPGGEDHVVHVLGAEPPGDAVGALLRASHRDAAPRHPVALRHHDLEIVGAEVGVELAVKVVLVDVPSRPRGAALAGQLEDPDLRVPLAGQVERVEPAGARHDPRHLVEEVDLERRRAAGRDGLGQVHPHHGVVGVRATVRVDEGPGRRPAALRDPAELHVAPLAVGGLDAGPERTVPTPLLHERRSLRLEGVRVEVEVDAPDRDGAPVAPGEPLAAGDGVLHRVEHGPDVVVGHPVGERRFLAGARAAPGPRVARRPDGSGVDAGDLDVGRRRSLFSRGGCSEKQERDRQAGRLHALHYPDVAFRCQPGGSKPPPCSPSDAPRTGATSITAGSTPATPSRSPTTATGASWASPTCGSSTRTA